MKKPNCIVINAFSRGGSNLLWNVMQSHPQVCAPKLETNKLMSRHFFHWAPFVPKLLRHDPYASLSLPLGWYVRRGFNQWKTKNYEHPNSGEKFDGVDYTKNEVEESILCLKGNDADIGYSNFFRSIYDDVRFLCLVRNGHALCDGWIRRGLTADEAGYQYQKVTSSMLQLCDEFEGSMIIKFEDLVQNPFTIAEKAYSFCGLDPERLSKLRLKSKRVITADGRHETRFGEQKKKYWFDSQEIKLALDNQINERQSARLNERDRKIFDSYAHENMRQLGHL